MIILFIVCGILLGSYCLIYAWQPRRLLELAARLSPEVLYFVPAIEPVVALTIDDGPHPTVTPAILDVLARNGARATFFVIGERAAVHAGLVDRMRAEGHELGNHSWSDFPSILLTAGIFERQLLMVDALIPPGVAGARWYRPGFAWYSRRMTRQLARHGYRICLGSVYPHDTKLRVIRLISNYITQRVFPGAILVLHDGRKDRIRTARVLERVLPELKRRGYRVVTVTELVRSAAAGGAGTRSLARGSH